MNEDVFNTSLRKFLKKVGIASQREIEKAVREALASGRLKGHEKLQAKMTLTIAGVGLVHDARCQRRHRAGLRLEAIQFAGWVERKQNPLETVAGMSGLSSRVIGSREASAARRCDCRRGGACDKARG